MNYRYPVPGPVRACVLLLLTVVFSTLAPSHVGRAQWDPPLLTPWVGLVDHASVNVYGQASQAPVDLTAKSLSADGRFVLMTSYAWDLVSEPNYYEGVFLRDRMEGTTRLVSVSHDGMTPPDGGSFAGSMSANGRQIAFMSYATNLVQGETNGMYHIFVRDLDAERTVRVSVASDGTEADAHSQWPVISANGRFVAFGSQATNLAGGFVPYEPMQVYVHDRDADGDGIFDEPGAVTTSLVSTSPNGGHADDWARNIRISGDGSVISFESRATNLFPGTTLDGTNHVYVHDRQLQQTTLIDRAITGGPSAWGVEFDSSDLSDDGRYVTYSSFSHDIVWLDMNWIAQAFRHDRADNTANATVIVSQFPEGEGGALANGNTYSTAVSGDGRYVVLRTVADNLASPSLYDGRGGVIVRDMVDGTFTRVDVAPDHYPFNHWYPYNVSISADGTAVAFNSDATNVVDAPNPYAQRVFVATAFAAMSGAPYYPIEGGAGSITVNTLPVAGWTAVSLDPWITLTDGAGFGAGPRVLNYIVDANPGGPRTGRIQFGNMIEVVYQDGAGDPTPPVIEPIVTGTHVNGWYTSNITLHWEVSDPESEIQINQGCLDATYTTDFMLATPSCTATSNGGTSSLSVSLRRDTTAPTVSITVPYATTYPLNAVVAPTHSCSDAGGSGIDSCTITTPIETASPGRKLFTVTATDLVGKTTSKSVEYIVGSGVCVAPNEGLTARFTFDEHTVDFAGGLGALPVPAVPVYYDPGVAGQAVHFQGDMYLTVDSPDGRLRVGEELTIAASVASGGNTIPYSTIVESPGQYTLAVFPDTSLRWRFSLPTGFNWVDTGVKLPRRADVFTHVAVTYDAGLVKTYVNGLLAHTHQLDGVVATSGDDPSITIGGSETPSTPLWGAIDELEIYNTALSASEIDALALAGSGTLCPPEPTTLELVAPDTVGYMSEMPVSARLLDQAGQPLAGREVAFWVYFSANGMGTDGRGATTDADGWAHTTIQLYSNSVPGTYAQGIKVFFDGNARYNWAQTSAATTVVRGTPTITWPTPAAITYGTPLGPQQLNATATIPWLYTNIPGTFAYSPAAGTRLNAGTQTLSVTFTPDDLTNWQPVTATRSIVVNKATPTISVNVGTFTYDKQPHPASVTITGANGEALSPIQVSYNGSQTVPVSAGSYWVFAYYAGSANYNSASRTSSTQLIIRRYVPTVEMYGGPYTYDGQQHYPAIYVRGAGGDYLTPFGFFFDGWTYNIPVSAGTHTVQVQYNGSYNYEAIIVEDLSFVINKATPSIWISNTNRFYNGSPQVASGFASGVNNVSLTPVVVTYNGSTTPPTAVGSYAMVASYNGSTNYNAVSANATMNILKGTPVVTWANPAAIVYGTPLGALQLNATTPVAGTFSYAQPAGTILPAGTHTLSTLFVPTDQSNWDSVNKSATLTVTKATPVVTWPAPGEMVYGTPLGSGQLNATSGVEGSFSYSPSAGTLLNAGTHQLSTTFTPSDTANYNGASGSASVTVIKATPSISWPQPGSMVYGTALGASQLNATSSVAGTFTYSPAAGTVLGAGSHTLSVEFTPADGANYNSTTASVSLEIAKATPVVTWNAPADVTYGAALGAAQLNASANVPGSFAYSPSAGTVLAAGTHTLSVTFTPNDAANYSGSTADVALTVTRAATGVSWNAPGTTTYGTALGAAQLNATASVPGTFTYAPAAGTVLPAGTHTLSVTFTPNDAANYAGSTGSTTVTVARAPLTVTANDASKPFGQPLPAFTSTLSGFVNGDTIASLSGALGYTTPATASSAVDSYAIAPSGVSSPNYNITFVNGTLTVVKAATVVTPAASPNPIGFDQPVTFTANVALAAPGLGTPTGFVQFFDGSTLIGSVPVTGGPVSLTTAGLAAGTRTLTATYSGDGSFNGSSSTATFTVNAAAASSTVAVSSSPNPSNPGQTVTFTAAVSGPAGTISGSVQFYDGATLLGSATISGTSASFTTSALAVGGHAITARFSGNASVPPSVSSAFAHTVKVSGTNPRSTTTAVTASPSPATLGSQVTLTATVTGSQNKVPTGTVVFLANGTVIGTATLSAIGSVTARATLPISTLPHGGHSISAVYLADATYRASRGTVKATVN